MRSVRRIAVLAVGVAAGWAARTWSTGSTPPAPSSSHAGPTVEQVRALSTLVTTRVDVADVVETRLEGYTGGARAALLVKGDFLLGTDLARARFESVDPVGRTAVLLLAQPDVTSPRLDHERTRLFAIDQRGLWRVVPGDGGIPEALVNRAYRDAQRFVAAAGGEPSLRPRSRRQAEEVLGAFFHATGWHVEVRWSD